MDFVQDNLDPAVEINRELMAKQIIAQSDKYQICEGCFSIVTKEACTCPNCHSYQFDTDLINIKMQAQILAKKVPSSVTAQDLL